MARVAAIPAGARACRFLPLLLLLTVAFGGAALGAIDRAHVPTPGANVAIAPGFSNVNRPGTRTNTYGRSLGLAFHDGVFYPVWPDNSNAVSGNPDPPTLDLVTLRATTDGTPTLGPAMDVSRLAGNEYPPSIAINPVDPRNLVVVSGIQATGGLVRAFTRNGGATWTIGFLPTGTASLASACCDPAVAFDSFGNCFLVYTDGSGSRVAVAVSMDGGSTFRTVALLGAGVAVDQPTVTTGPDGSGQASVWVAFTEVRFGFAQVVAAGARVTGPGLVGAFGSAALPGSTNCSFADVAVGPAGQVMVVYQNGIGGPGPSTLLVNVDPDGLGPAGFSAATAVASTEVGGLDAIPAVPGTIDAEPGLAWDRSGGAHNGRVYLVYTDERGSESNDTEILLRYSDDGGARWRGPIRVNDDPGTNSQFLPRIALDQTTGNVVVTWMDCREDTGPGSAADTDLRPNTDARLFGALVRVPPPPAPSGLVATALGSDRIRLDWTDNSSDEQGFEIERRTGTAAFVRIASVGANVTGYTDAGLTPNTTYVYRVRAFNGGGFSAYSNEARATTLPALAPPAAPSDLRAVPASSTSVRLTWADNSDNEDGFRVERRTGTAAFAEIAQTGANATAYTDTGLVAGTTYTYRVRAFNAAGNSAYSNEASAVPGGPPAAPSNLRATALSPTEIRLDWDDNSADESAFHIERKPGPSGDPDRFEEIRVTPADTRSLVDAGLARGATYTYRVRARNAAGFSAYSNEASATTPNPPAAPSNLTATALSSSAVRLTWQDNSDNEDGFTVEQKVSPTIYAEIARLPADTTLFLRQGLQPDTIYIFRVRAFRGNDFSPYSNEAAARTFPAPNPPAAPSDLVATALSSSEIRLVWRDNSTNEQGFRIERRTGTAPFAPIASVGPNTASHTDSGLAAGTTYTYRVRAFNSAGVSAYSNEASATTPGGPRPPAAPSNLTATAISATQIRLAWRDNSDNEVGFEVERRTAATAFVRIARLAANATAFTNGGLTAGTTYTYRVRAFNAAGSSAYSNEASATPGGGGGSAPAPPSDLTAAALASARIRLAWRDNSDNESGFRIERKTGSGSFVPIATVVRNATSFTDSGLTIGVTYTYRVRAFNRAGSSAYSNEATAIARF